MGHSLLGVIHCYPSLSRSMSYRVLWATHCYGAMGYTLLSISTHLYELLSLAIQCYGRYVLLISMDRADTFPDVTHLYISQTYTTCARHLLIGISLRWTDLGPIPWDLLRLIPDDHIYIF